MHPDMTWRTKGEQFWPSLKGRARQLQKWQRRGDFFRCHTTFKSYGFLFLFLDTRSLEEKSAFLPFTAPMVFLSLLSVKNLKSMILPQVSFYTYTTAFNIINGNASYNRQPYESILLGTGVIASSTFFGLLPRFLQLRFSLNNILTRKALPVVFLTQVSAVNVIASRSFEPSRGIEVMDKEGNVIGYSRKAGTKAVKDTATSRAVLFGTSAFIPEVFSYFFKRTQFFQQYPWSLWTLKLSCTILVMGLMVPVSFSIFPQTGQIQCSMLEKEIQSATQEPELFYNRGV
uniref:Sideroflexin 4 n=1 Tax=Equus caballus TaxID=9796 RepID=A0A9L0R430_HORSE